MNILSNHPILHLPDILSYVNFKPSIIRGLDYYTGFVFEVFSHNFNRALCGGGFYGDLLEKFQGESLPGIGFGLGDVTFTDLLETSHKLPQNSTTVNGLFGCAKEYNSSWANALRKKFSIASIYEPIHPQKLFKEATALHTSSGYSYGPPAIVKPSFEMYGEWLLENNRPKEALEQFELALKLMHMLSKGQGMGQMMNQMKNFKR